MLARNLPAPVAVMNQMTLDDILMGPFLNIHRNVTVPSIYACVCSVFFSTGQGCVNKRFTLMQTIPV
jgi:hypothetical protein